MNSPATSTSVASLVHIGQKLRVIRGSNGRRFDVLLAYRFQHRSSARRTPAKPPPRTETSPASLCGSRVDKRLVRSRPVSLLPTDSSSSAGTNCSASVLCALPRLTFDTASQQLQGSFLPRPGQSQLPDSTSPSGRFSLASIARLLLRDWLAQIHRFVARFLALILLFALPCSLPGRNLFGYLLRFHYRASIAARFSYGFFWHSPNYTSSLFHPVNFPRAGSSDLSSGGSSIAVHSILRMEPTP